MLLSIFRGAEFIQEQLESLIAQEGVRIRLIFHMDEEDPPTEAKVRTAFPDAQRITVSPGQGLPRAFFELILAAPPTDFYAFCDQDDVWHPGKLMTAVEALNREGNSPVLWICRVQPFRGPTPLDFNGDPYPSCVPKPSFGNALVETIAPGCAMVWNASLNDRLLCGQPIRGAKMHDSWLYLLATSMGRVILAPDSLVMYRLHDDNAVGIDASITARLGRLWAQWRHTDQASVISQAVALLENHGSQLQSRSRAIAGIVANGRVFPIVRSCMTGELHMSTQTDQWLLPWSLSVLSILHRRR